MLPRNLPILIRVSVKLSFPNFLCYQLTENAKLAVFNVKHWALRLNVHFLVSTLLTSTPPFLEGTRRSTVSMKLKLLRVSNEEHWAILQTV